jgi:hypothetical protein
MDQGNGMMRGIIEQNRLAVREAKQERYAGRGCEQSISIGNPMASITARNEGNMISMHLVS